MSVTGQFKDDAMLRQVSEAVMINKEGKENVMNSKNEWNYINHESFRRKKIRRQNFGEKIFGQIFRYFGQIFRSSCLF